MSARIALLVALAINGTLSTLLSQDPTVRWMGVLSSCAAYLALVFYGWFES